jgi:hypothetical protein
MFNENPYTIIKIIALLLRKSHKTHHENTDYVVQKRNNGRQYLVVETNYHHYPELVKILVEFVNKKQLLKPLFYNYKDLELFSRHDNVEFREHFEGCSKVFKFGTDKEEYYKYQ